MNRAEIIIVGGGLMGVSTGLNLARAGRKVVLLEKEGCGRHASAVNAGGVRRLNRAFAEIPISAAAGEMWPRLGSIVGDDCGFHPVGQVRIAPGEKEMQQLEERVAKVQSLGYSHEEIIDSTEVQRLVPAYGGKCKGGIVTRSDGHALPARTLKAYYNAADKAGVLFQTNWRVVDISRDRESFTVKGADGRCLQGEIVVNCAGAWGKQVASFIGDRLPIEPVGLTMMATCRMAQFLTPVVGIQGHKLSFKQTANGSVVIGGGHRAVLDMKTERNIVQVAEIKKSGQTVLNHFPIMQKSSVVRTWAGIEGMVGDGLPIIDESPSIGGMFHVCGFSAHGFQLAPKIGQLAASLVQGKAPELSLEAFSMDRFKAAS